MSLPSSAFNPADVDAALDVFAASAPTLPLAVAFSGGADSTALLLGCVQRWPGKVQACHVHHGLQAAADDFERHCAAVCQRLGVPLCVRRVDARPQPGQSPEDAARIQRQKALDALTRSACAKDVIKTVVIAQHADDQVETILLALSRGAGLPGLAAMPARWQRGELAYARPLLAVPAGSIRAWLRAQGQDWIEDPSNTDARYTRNRIRAQLLPALGQTFAAFRDTFARSAAHAAQAQAVLAEVAAQDLAACGVPPQLADLRTLGTARRANLLRHWLRTVHGQTPTSAQLAALQRQIEACVTRGHRIDLKLGQGRVRRAGAVLDWAPEAVEPTASGND